MSAAKPLKPATALPWIEDADYDAQIIYGDGERVKVATCRGSETPRAQNAAYIVTACNAYPQLVAAAKHARETMLKRGMPTQHDLLEAAALIKNLLRSLGEIE